MIPIYLCICIYSKLSISVHLCIYICICWCSLNGREASSDPLVYVSFAIDPSIPTAMSGMAPCLVVPCLAITDCGHSVPYRALSCTVSSNPLRAMFNAFLLCPVPCRALSFGSFPLPVPCCAMPFDPAVRSVPCRACLAAVRFGSAYS